MLTQNQILDYVKFPNPNTKTDEDGVLAMGGELNLEFLISAYRQGVFPWFNEGEPVLWWSPNPRCVLELDKIYVSKTVKQQIRKKEYTLRLDTDFKSVISNCQKVKRKNEDGTWISNDIIDAYLELHNLGIAHSVEVYNEQQDLVGGLYGLSIGKMFYGESMFAKESNTSKIAFVFLAHFLKSISFDLLDCQVTNPHLLSLGCIEIDRKKFLKINKQSIENQTLIGKWTEIANKFGKDFVI